MTNTTDKAFIIGANHSAVSTDIRLDLGWSRLSRDTWQDDDGRTVHYLYSSDKLRGRPKGTVVYLMPGFDERQDWWQIDDILRHLDCDRIYV